MKPYKDMTRFEKRITQAVRNGWYMSGEYVAIQGDRQRRFEADSICSLARDICKWLGDGKESNDAEHLLVRQTMVG